MAMFVLATGTAWLVAVISAISILGLTPKGSKLKACFDLGWWRFDKLRTLIGPAAEPHLKRYRLSLLAFFALIFGMISMIFLLEVLQLAHWPEL